MKQVYMIKLENYTGFGAALGKPFVFGGYKYATNRAVLIRIPCNEPDDAVEDWVKVGLKSMDSFSALKSWEPISVHVQLCPRCKGQIEYICEHCKSNVCCDCYTGLVQQNHPIIIGLKIDIDYARSIALIDGCEVCVGIAKSRWRGTNDPLTDAPALFFRGEGAEGVVMPIVEG